MKKINKRIAKIVDLKPGSVEVMIINNIKGIELYDTVFYNLTGEELYFTYLDKTVDCINPSVYLDNRIPAELSNYIGKHKKMFTTKSIKYISKKAAERRLKFLKSKYDNYGENKMFITDLAEYKSLVKLLDNYNNIIKSGAGLHLPKLNIEIYIEYSLDSLTDYDVVEDTDNKISIGKVLDNDDIYVPSFSVKEDTIVTDEDNVVILYKIFDNESSKVGNEYWITLNTNIPIKVLSDRDSDKKSGLYQYLKYSNGKLELVDCIYKDNSDDFSNNVFHNKTDAEISIKSGREKIENLKLKIKELEIKTKEIENKEKKVEAMHEKYKIDMESMERKHEINKDTMERKHKIEVVKSNSEYIKAGAGLVTGLIAGYVFFKSKIFSDKGKNIMMNLKIFELFKIVKEKAFEACKTISSKAGVVLKIVKEKVAVIIKTCSDKIVSGYRYLLNGVRSLFSFA